MYIVPHDVTITGHNSYSGGQNHTYRCACSRNNHQSRLQVPQGTWKLAFRVYSGTVTNLKVLIKDESAYVSNSSLPVITHI